MDAASKVFHTTELLEQIIFYLPLRDVLPLMRVLQSCQAIILGSSIIQKAIFQLSITSIGTHNWKYVNELNGFIDLESRNPSLIYAEERTENEDPSMAVVNLYRRLPRRPSTFNPSIFVIFGGLHELYFKNDRQKNHLQDTGVAHSWKTMFVTQPPVKVVELDLELKTEELYRHAKMAARHKEKTQRTRRWPDDLKCTNEGGVTFGDESQAMKEIWEEMQHVLEAEELEGHGGVLEFDILNTGGINTF